MLLDFLRLIHSAFESSSLVKEGGLVMTSKVVTQPHTLQSPCVGSISMGLSCLLSCQWVWACPVMLNRVDGIAMIVTVLLIR